SATTSTRSRGPSRTNTDCLPRQPTCFCAGSRQRDSHDIDRRSTVMRTLIAALLAIACPSALILAQPPAPPAGPVATISLKDRHGHAVPLRQGFTHTGGGNIDVAQPAPDTVVVTMTGVAVAGAHPCKDSSASLTFDL